MNQVKSITMNAPKCIPAMWHRHTVNRAKTTGSLIVASSELHQCQIRHLHMGDLKINAVNIMSYDNEMTANVEKHLNSVGKIKNDEKLIFYHNHQLFPSVNSEGQLCLKTKGFPTMLIQKQDLMTKSSTISNDSVNEVENYDGKILFMGQEMTMSLDTDGEICLTVKVPEPLNMSNDTNLQDSIPNPSILKHSLVKLLPIALVFIFSYIMNS